MNKMYLIQRGTFSKHLTKVTNDWIFGSKQENLIELDYMGSAEFEFGATRHSLERIAESEKEYSYHTILDICHYYNKNPLIVYCKNNEFEDINRELHKYLELTRMDMVRKYILKEFISFEHLYYGQCLRFSRGDDFWWDIDNDFMFFFASEHKKRLNLFKNILSTNLIYVRKSIEKMNIIKNAAHKSAIWWSHFIDENDNKPYQIQFFIKQLENSIVSHFQKNIFNSSILIRYRSKPDGILEIAYNKSKIEYPELSSIDRGMEISKDGKIYVYDATYNPSLTEFILLD